MTDTTHGLPDDVLEQAAEAVSRSGTGLPWDHLHSELQKLYRDDLVAALPILTPAIERLLLQRMIADAEEVDAETSIYPIYPDGHESSEPLILADWLRTYLPAATEGADHE